jgi:hypothetical protein
MIWAEECGHACWRDMTAMGPHGTTKQHDFVDPNGDLSGRVKTLLVILVFDAEAGATQKEPTAGVTAPVAMSNDTDRRTASTASRAAAQ